MNSYSKAALEAVRLFTKDIAKNPRDAWEKSTTEIFGKGTSSQKKGCPRGSFLGLCQEGLVKNIPSGQYCETA